MFAGGSGPASSSDSLCFAKSRLEMYISPRMATLALESIFSGSARTVRTFGVTSSPVLVISVKLLMVALALAGIYASMRIAEKIAGPDAGVICGILSAAFPPSLQKEIKSHGIEAYQAFGTADLGLIAYDTPARDGRSDSMRAVISRNWSCRPERSIDGSGEAGTTDGDGNGKVSYREFEAVMSGRKTRSEPH